MTHEFHINEEMTDGPYRHAACEFTLSTDPKDDFATLAIGTGGARIQTYLSRDEIQRLEKALYQAWEALKAREEPEPTTFDAEDVMKIHDYLTGWAAP
jgi:hypothetical protein